MIPASLRCVMRDAQGVHHRQELGPRQQRHGVLVHDGLAAEKAQGPVRAPWRPSTAGRRAGRGGARGAGGPSRGSRRRSRSNRSAGARAEPGAGLRPGAGARGRAGGRRAACCPPGKRGTILAVKLQTPLRADGRRVDMAQEVCDTRRSPVAGRTLVARREGPDGRWFCRLGGYITVGHQSPQQALSQAASFVMRRTDADRFPGALDPDGTQET